MVVFVLLVVVVCLLLLFLGFFCFVLFCSDRLAITVDDLALVLFLSFFPPAVVKLLVWTGCPRFSLPFLTRMKNVSLYDNRCPAGRPTSRMIVRRGKNFNVGICSDTVNVINVKPCLMVLLVELYLVTPL